MNALLPGVLPAMRLHVGLGSLAFCRKGGKATRHRMHSLYISDGHTTTAQMPSECKRGAD
eukprot:1844132-Amphidinium_carterae.1